MVHDLPRAELIPLLAHEARFDAPDLFWLRVSFGLGKPLGLFAGDVVLPCMSLDGRRAGFVNVGAGLEIRRALHSDNATDALAISHVRAIDGDPLNLRSVNREAQQGRSLHRLDFTQRVVPLLVQLERLGTAVRIAQP